MVERNKKRSSLSALVYFSISPNPHFPTFMFLEKIMLTWEFIILNSKNYAKHSNSFERERLAPHYLPPSNLAHYFFIFLLEYGTSAHVIIRVFTHCFALLICICWSPNWNEPHIGMGTPQFGLLTHPYPYRYGESPYRYGDCLFFAFFSHVQDRPFLTKNLGNPNAMAHAPLITKI